VKQLKGRELEICQLLSQDFQQKQQIAKDAEERLQAFIDLANPDLDKYAFDPATAKYLLTEEDNAD